MTLSLVIGATVLTAVIAAVLGVWAAIRRGWVDKLVQAVTILGFAIPGFLIAVGLVLLFAINLGLFEPTGYVTFTDDPGGLAGSGDAADHRAGHRRHRRRGRTRSAGR